MSIYGISGQTRYTVAPTAGPKAESQAATAPSATVDGTKAGAQAGKPVSADDLAGRLGNIPDLNEYEALIQRFLSGESEMESADKPLTEDQIALRGLMRAYHKTDPRTLSQIQGSMQLANKNFLSYWVSSGNTGPMPGRVISADGSFRIFHSKAEKDEYMKNQQMSFLERVMSVIQSQKSSAANQSEKLDRMA